MKLAGIDIGSNAVRLIINRVMQNGGTQLKRAEFIRVPLRLGDDAFSQKYIGEAKEEQLLKTIQSFALLMEVHHVSHYRACATSAMRDAANGREVAQRIESETGIHIEIIDGYLESKLILESVMDFFSKEGDFLNIDVGGGSTEITVIHDRQAVYSQSFNIGTVRLLYGNVSDEEWDKMHSWVVSNSKNLKSLMAVGTGGNINKSLRMLGMGDRDSASFEKLKSLSNLIKDTTMKERIYKLKLNPDRADVIEPALKIYLSIMKWASIKKIYAPNVGLKDGIIKELVDEFVTDKAVL